MLKEEYVKKLANLVKLEYDPCYLASLNHFLKEIDKIKDLEVTEEEMFTPINAKLDLLDLRIDENIDVDRELVLREAPSKVGHFISVKRVKND